VTPWLSEQRSRSGPRYCSPTWSRVRTTFPEKKKDNNITATTILNHTRLTLARSISHRRLARRRHRPLSLRLAPTPLHHHIRHNPHSHIRPDPLLHALQHLPATRRHRDPVHRHHARRKRDEVVSRHHCAWGSRPHIFELCSHGPAGVLGFWGI
jgi:hypothetical protein